MYQIVLDFLEKFTLQQNCIKSTEQRLIRKVSGEYFILMLNNTKNINILNINNTKNNINILNINKY